MKVLGQFAGLVILVVVAMWVAAGILPKLLPMAAIIFAFVVIGRVVWFYTRRW
jgi:hypothetical protein